jgi:hypothetical protein
MAEPKYGAFESNPAIFTDDEAWVYQHDKVWRKMNSAEVLMGAHVMSAAQFRSAYGHLPALPSTAFQGHPRPPSRESQQDHRPGTSSSAAAAERKYGVFESNPAVSTDYEAWVYQHDNVWRKMSPPEVLMGAHVMSAAEFHSRYGHLLSILPSTAFQGDPWQTGQESQQDRRKADSSSAAPEAEEEPEKRKEPEGPDNLTPVEQDGFSVTENEDRTSAGVPWSKVPEFARQHVTWMDGRHGSAQTALPSLDIVPVPDVLKKQYPRERLQPGGTKAMIDAAGARARLRDLRPGAWLISPYTGWKWAKWPNGEVGSVPADVDLPTSLQVPSRNDIQ